MRNDILPVMPPYGFGDCCTGRLLDMHEESWASYVTCTICDGEGKHRVEGSVCAVVLFRAASAIGSDSTILADTQLVDAGAVSTAIRPTPRSSACAPTGLSRRELAARIRSIEAFAEIGEYLDREWRASRRCGYLRPAARRRPSSPSGTVNADVRRDHGDRAMQDARP